MSRAFVNEDWTPMELVSVLSASASQRAERYAAAQEQSRKFKAELEARLEAREVQHGHKK